MRTIHRWVSVPVGLFLGLIGITGVYLQSDILLDHYFPAQGSDAQALSLDEVPRLLDNALAQTRRAAPGARIDSIELSARGGVAHADVIFAGPGSHLQTFDARSSDPAAQPLAASSRGSQPLRLRLRTLVINLHQGGIIGVVGGLVGLLCGAALVTLAITGLVVYIRLYRQRWKLRRRSMFW
jgi:uncharacterized iron-regulated membrane protein